MRDATRTQRRTRRTTVFYKMNDDIDEDNFLEKRRLKKRCGALNKSMDELTSHKEKVQGSAATVNADEDVNVDTVDDDAAVGEAPEAAPGNDGQI